jgi:hypothetical protein
LNNNFGFALLLAVILSIAAGNCGYAQKVLDGEVCSTRVHELTSDINWYKNLRMAENEARAEGKLVLWIHMVGKIDGAT